MSQINTGRPVYQKGHTTPNQKGHTTPNQKRQTPPKAPRKQMKRNTKPKDVCEPGKMFVSEKLRKFAKGQPCQMQGPWCNGDNEKSAFCHSRRRAGAGTNQKPHDFWGYHGCSECHAHEDTATDGDLFDAIRRTQYAVFEHFGTLTP